MKRSFRPFVTLAPAALALLVFAMPSQASAKGGGNDLVSFGNDVTVREGQEVKGDLVVFGGDAKVYGHVDGDAAVMGGDLYIAPTGQVDGSTVAFGGSVDNESSQAGSGKHKSPDNSGYVPPVPVVPPVPDVGNGGDETDHGPPTAWYTLLTVLGILSLLAFAIAPGTVRILREELVRRPAVGTVVGFSWPFILVVVMIALAITVIGIVLMPAVMVAVIVAYFLGRATVAQLLGRRLFEVANVVEPAPLATAALGLVIITVVEALLPLWMGIVLEACVSCVALGAAMLPLLHGRSVASFQHAGGYAPPPTPVFTPPSPPPPSGPPAVPQ
jgi:hypothetical protein